MATQKTSKPHITDWGVCFEVSTELEALRIGYEHRNAPHGYQVRKIPSGWQVTVFNDKAASMGIDGANR